MTWPTLPSLAELLQLYIEMLIFDLLRELNAAHNVKTDKFKLNVPRDINTEHLSLF